MSLFTEFKTAANWILLKYLQVFLIKHLLNHISIREMEEKGPPVMSSENHGSWDSMGKNLQKPQFLSKCLNREKTAAPKKKGPDPTIHCKTCHEEFATLVQGSWAGLTISKETEEQKRQRKKCVDCRKGNDASKLVCRLCDKSIVKANSSNSSGGPDFAVGGSKLHSSLEEHMRSAEHTQREIVLNYYKEFASIKGFNWAKDVDAKYLKFFLNVLQAKAVHEKITQICCLSALTNSLEISPSMYASLYKHLDYLIRHQVNNFACFLCTSCFFTWKELQEHVLTQQHIGEQAVWASRLQNTLISRKAVLCAECDIFVEDDNLDAHRDHELPETVKLQEPKRAKRKSGGRADITEEEEEEVEAEEEEWEEWVETQEDEIEEESSDSSAASSPQKSSNARSSSSPAKTSIQSSPSPEPSKSKTSPKNSKVVEARSSLEASLKLDEKTASMDTVPSVETQTSSSEKDVPNVDQGLKDLDDLMEKESSEKARPAKRIKLEKVSHADAENPTEPEDIPDYVYFCLDCEAESGNSEEELKSRFPLSIDLAGHINATSHQNFSPIKETVKVKLNNLSYTSEHNATIIKKWRRLVKDGDITSIKYSPPRKCKKCDMVFEDSVDMFKHIKSSHIEI